MNLPAHSFSSLSEGGTSLVKDSLQPCDGTSSSICVNPNQNLSDISLNVWCRTDDGAKALLDPYFALSELLSEVQIALARAPEKTRAQESLKEVFARIDRAAEMRARLWAAICRYRDDWAR